MSGQQILRTEDKDNEPPRSPAYYPDLRMKRTQRGQELAPRVATENTTRGQGHGRFQREDNASSAAAPADNVIRAPQYDVDAKESLKITSVWEEVAVQVSLLSPSFSPLSRTACGPHLGKTIS